MKKYHFQNTVHIQTDGIGKHSDTWIAIGLQSYPENKEKHIDSHQYFSFDAVKQLVYEGKTTDNVCVSNDGKVELHNCHLSAITVFPVVNGIAFISNASKEKEELLTYCKRKGYVSDTPVPVEMMVGVKNLEIIGNDTYKMSYTFLPEKLGLEKVNEFMEESTKKLMIGTIKRLSSKRTTLYMGQGRTKIKPQCEIKKWEYDENTTTISLVTTREGIASDGLLSTILQMDLQLYYFYNPNINWIAHLEALKQCARDYGQAHWINEDWDDANDHFQWYDK